ncbi:MAG: biopolymer transporter ExbD [Deltaproteobacteria bacterium]|nr:biopolymer transporter ExbD [Deltaproteobacteria bacterium]
MSVAPEAGDQGGRKAVDSNLNLVPYIDLLTCMVTFLLITAVWTQLARVDVTQKVDSNDPEAALRSPLPATKLVVQITEEGYVIGGAGTGAEPRKLAKKDGRYDLDTLLAVLKEVKRTAPDKRDIHIGVDDGIWYEHVVRTMDAALAAHFPEVSVTDLAAAHL